MVRRLACAGLLLLAGCASAKGPGGGARPFVPADFEVPSLLETPRYRIRPLVAGDAAADYRAVMESARALQQIFPDSDWPRGLTLAQDRQEILQHEDLFAKRRAFAYAVVSLDGARVLGSVYVHPSTRANYDAEIYLWARASARGSPADLELEATVRAWIATSWPFSRPAFPGRTIPWEAWRALPPR